MKTLPDPAVPDYGAPATLPPTCLLTAEQIAFYQEHGYLAVESVMPVEEVAVVRGIYDRLFDAARTGAGVRAHDLGGTADTAAQAAIPQILQPARYAPELLATQMVANLKAMMRQLHGEETRLVGDHAINKPPGNAAPTPWHQDEAYWDPAKEYASLSAWVALQPATTRNGCMVFIPGSHRGEVVPHRPIGDNPRSLGLEVEPGAMDLRAAVACELPAGGATFHHGRTLHFTGANRSDDFRRAYIALAAAYERPRAVPRRFPWQERQKAAQAE
jgi:ectoine hydroxylase-related dioxygenase (phytanoyl-CoA dioxygenase family)